MESNELKKVLSEQIAEACSGMKSFEKPLKWIYTLDPFTQENQLLTPKMSLRRNNVLKIYMPQFDSVYSGEAGVAMKDYGIIVGSQHDA